MIAYCKKLNKLVQKASDGLMADFSVTFEVLTVHTFTSYPPKPTVAKGETISVLRHGHPILKAVKKGNKLRVVFANTYSDLIMDYDGFCSRFDGTIFEKLNELLTFDQFCHFSLWMVSSGYYFKKTETAIRFDQIKDLEMKLSPLVGHGE